MRSIISRYKYIFSFLLSFILLDLILRIMTNNSQYHIYNILFDLSWISLLLSLILVLKRRYKIIVYSVFTSFFIVMLITNSMFYKFFGTMFSFSKIGMAKEGTGYLIQVLNSIPILTLITAIITIILVIITSKLFPKDINKMDKKFSIFFLLFGLLTRLLTINALGPSIDESDYKSLTNQRDIYNTYLNTNKAYSISGIYEYTFKDLYKTYIKKNTYDIEKTKKEISKYFSSKESHKNNEYTNIFKDKNVILVQMESIDNFLVTKETMPTLYNMMKTGINFTNHYAPRYGGGDTFNTEFTVNTGLLPPTTGHVSLQYKDTVYSYALPELFNNNGYKTESYHFNDSKMYARGTIHKAFGYSKYNGLTDMGFNVHDAEKDSIFGTNKDLYNSIVKNNKFMSFIITYSGHMPYSKQNYLCKSTLKGDIKGNEELECIRAQAKETDNMFKSLIDNLKKDNKLKDTVIVVWSDHFAFGIYDTDKLHELKNTDDLNLLTKTPLIIWNSELDSITVEKVNGSVDVLPTIANMFGLTNNYEYYMGNDIFDNNYNGLVYFNNFDWYDGTNYYKNDKLAKGDISKLDINKINKDIYEKMNINEKIFITNYFKK